MFDYDFLEDLVRLRDHLIANPSENVQPEVTKVSQKIIDWINTGKIVLSGYWDEDARSYSYKDFRTDVDKNPSTGDPVS